MHASRHPRFFARPALLLVGSAALLSVGTGCSTGSSYQTSHWATAPAPQIRTGIGDSLGNALFLREVQLAKSAQFHSGPTFAAETTD